MTQERFCDIGVYPLFEQMDCEGMAHAMGRKTLVGDRGAASGCQAKIFLDDGSYAEASKGEPSLVDEKAIHCGWSGFAAMLIPVELKELDGRRPQGV